MNIHSLSKQKVGVNDPLYGLAREELMTEMSMYLQWVGNPKMATSLVIAVEQVDNQKMVVGFMIVTAHIVGSKVAGVNYAAVREGYRRQGVLRLMMADLTQRIPKIGLSASVENVPVYEKLGFFPIERRGTHVAMANCELPKGQMMSVDMEYVGKLPHVQHQRSMLRDKYGKKVRDVYAEFERAQRQEGQRAQEYLASRGIA